MANEHNELIGGTRLDSESKSPTKTEGMSANDRQLKRAVTPYARKGKKTTIGRGILSSNPRQALIDAGENIHELVRIERSLREELQPIGAIAQILFDRLLSCLWRCMLIARKEKNVFAAENQPGTFEERFELAKQAGKLAFVSGNSNPGDNQPAHLLKNLSITQRYDAHVFREFYRALGMLLALRGGGDAGLTLLLAKTFMQNKDVSGETND
jgi:hypothetical protein